MTLQLFQQISVRCWVGHLVWPAQYLVRLEGDDVALRNVNDVSYVMRINHKIHFARQVQHLVKFMCHFLWHVQHLVKFMCHSLWQVQHLVKFHVRKMRMHVPPPPAKKDA